MTFARSADGDAEILEHPTGLAGRVEKDVDVDTVRTTQQRMRLHTRGLRADMDSRQPARAEQL